MAVEIFEDIFGPNHPDVARALSNKASFLEAQVKMKILTYCVTLCLCPLCKWCSVCDTVGGRGGQRWMIGNRYPCLCLWCYVAAGMVETFEEGDGKCC